MKPYNPLEKENLGKSVADSLISQHAVPLGSVSPFQGAGVYKIMKTQHRVLLTENADDYYAEIALVEVDDETGEFRRVGDVLVGDSETDLKAKMESCRAAFWRQRLVVDSVDGSLSKDWPELEGDLDEFHRHEALDRASLWLNQFCENVAAHPVMVASADYSDRCEKITDLLADLYQDIGRENYEVSGVE